MSEPACPLCAGPARVLFTARDLNRAVDDARFTYARCRRCATRFLLDPPADIGRYYPQGYFVRPDAQELESAARAERPSLEPLLAHVEGGRLVEVGPGDGAFSRAARNAGFAVTGIELDADASEHLRAVAGVEAINSGEPERVLPTLAPSDAIVLRHVIEHLPRPWELLAAAAENLRTGGVLLIATPNPAALQFRLLRSRWAHLDAPRHLFLIPAQTLSRRAQELGLRPASTTTTDPAGLHWNRFGWEYAVRRTPRWIAGGRARSAAARLLARSFAPLETRAMNGCAYTSIFIKTARDG